MKKGIACLVGHHIEVDYSFPPTQCCCNGPSGVGMTCFDNETRHLPWADSDVLGVLGERAIAKLLNRVDRPGGSSPREGSGEGHVDDNLLLAGALNLGLFLHGDDILASNVADPTC